MQKVSAYNKALMGKGAKFWFLHVVIIGQNSLFHSYILQYMNLQLGVYKKKEHGWYYVFEVT